MTIAPHDRSTVGRRRQPDVGGRSPWLRAPVLVAVIVLAGLGWSMPARYAAADKGDRITSFAVDAALDTSGVLAVTETIGYHFGSTGRHGIDRTLVTREPDPDHPGMDAVYTVGNVRVTSPTGAPTQVSRSDSEAAGGREVSTRLRIGDPGQTLDRADETYRISYTVAGLMRSFASYDELYWDVTGFGWTVPIDTFTLNVTVPDGTPDVRCFAGPPKSTTACASAVAAQPARFRALDLTPGSGVTVGIKVRSGLVSDNKPHLQPDASAPTPAQHKLAVAAVTGGGLVAVAAPLVGVLWWRRNGRDHRFVGLPPGTLPYPGQQAEIGYSDRHIQIPVAFSPPATSPAEAGLLLDGQVDARETGATIVDLAVRGALRIEAQADDSYQVRLLDPARAGARHETVLLQRLFPAGEPGTIVDLSVPGALMSAHSAMVAEVRREVAAQGWFRQVPGTRSRAGFGLGAVILVAVVLFQLGHALWWLVLLLAPVILTIAVVAFRLRRGQRTAVGRAVCDQVEGFRTYLATAEADQLRFEEGEDIYSRYLPWAIAFDLADRWARLCADLVAAGRLPDQVPYWYAGQFNLTAFNIGFLSSMSSAAAPPPPPAGGGTGFGTGGSSFSGGISGGGGGGGGGGSW